MKILNKLNLGFKLAKWYQRTKILLWVKPTGKTFFFFGAMYYMYLKHVRLVYVGLYVIFIQMRIIIFMKLNNIIV